MSIDRDGHQRTNNRRRLASALGIVALAAFAVACSRADEASGPVVDDVPAGSVPTGSVPIGSVPAESTPATLPPPDAPSDDATPQASAPVVTEPAETPASSAPQDQDAPGEGRPGDASADEASDPAIAWLAAAGFVVLVGVAAWWMLRRDDPDAQIGQPDAHDWPDDQMSL